MLLRFNTKIVAIPEFTNYKVFKEIKEKAFEIIFDNLSSQKKISNNNFYKISFFISPNELGILYLIYIILCSPVLLFYTFPVIQFIISIPAYCSIFILILAELNFFILFNPFKYLLLFNEGILIKKYFKKKFLSWNNISKIQLKNYYTINIIDTANNNYSFQSVENYFYIKTLFESFYKKINIEKFDDFKTISLKYNFL